MRAGSRESALAMRQTEMFVDAMRASGYSGSIDVVGIKSLGDIDLTSPLDKMSATGAFVRELDAAIKSGSIDVSVNSLKDIPIDMEEGLTIGAIMRRDPVEDIIMPIPLGELPPGAKIGTSSIRRISLIKEARPDVECVPLRGNIHTRMDKLDKGEYDAIVLAKAGMHRMGISRDMFPLDPLRFVPAPAQGAVAIECRSDDAEVLAALSKIDDKVTRECVTIERSIMRSLGAGCSSPVGIYVRKLVGGFSVNAVSFAFTEEPVRLSKVIPHAYGENDIAEIADILRGKE
ncbi:MAG: hydroxymethylbilane synthase [Candidatus Methanomethylophilaceae archaeon]|nr:hydroxymethylbilane synthase [Candidatus Methanomethylophilaceae archaeon]